MKLQQKLLDIASDLNDAEPGHQHVTWAQSSLQRWFNEGMCNAFTLNPTKFTETKILKLGAGTDQEPCDCAILHKILGQTDRLGRITTPIKRADESVALRWFKPSACPPARGPFALTEYTFDPLENGHFSVRPPVPPNEDVFMKVVCYVRPGALNLDDEIADCELVTAATQWVLYRALMVDDESAPSVAMAQVHGNMFFTLLKVQYTQELALQLGMTGMPAAPRATAKGALK